MSTPIGPDYFRRSRAVFLASELNELLDMLALDDQELFDQLNQSGLIETCHPMSLLKCSLGYLITHGIRVAPITQESMQEAE